MGQAPHPTWQSIANKKPQFGVSPIFSHSVSDPPQVSVIMSVFNGGRYLREALESILTQDGVTLELIVVNDGSTDESAAILAEYALQDKRIRVVDQPNSGLTAALILGCSHAQGEFIARQDADDLSMPGRLRHQVCALDADASLVFVSSAAQGVGPNGEAMEIVNRPVDPVVATHQLLYEKTGPPAHGSVMMRRSSYGAVGGYRPEFYFAQDSDLWLRLGRLGKLMYLSDVLYSWRVSPGGISTVQHGFQWQFGDLGQACHAAILRGESEAAFLAEAAALTARIRIQKCGNEPAPGGPQAWGLYRIGTTLARQGDKRARSYFWQTICAQPLHARAWIRLLLSFLPMAARSSGDHDG